MKQKTGFDLSEQESETMSMQLIQIDAEKAHLGEKLFQLTKSKEDRADTFKVICALLRMFSDMVKVKQGLKNSELIWCSDWILKTYTHESVEDIALALKQALFEEKTFYGVLTIGNVKDIISSYFERKIDLLEEQHNTLKYEPDDPLIFEASRLILAKSKEENVNTLDKLKEWEKGQKRARATEVLKEYQNNVEKIMKVTTSFQDLEKGGDGLTK